MIKKTALLSILVIVLAFGMTWAQEGATTDTAKQAEKTETAEKAEMSDMAVEVEAAVCTAVEERLPVGTADVFPAEVGQVYFWTKVEGLQDTTMIKHVWYYKGDEIATVQLPVRSSSWRTYSYKTIPPEWSGDWVVKVVDADGEVLKAVPFKVGEEKMSTTE